MPGLDTVSRTKLRGVLALLKTIGVFKCSKENDEALTTMAVSKAGIHKQLLTFFSKRHCLKLENVMVALDTFGADRLRQVQGDVSTGDIENFSVAIY
jgi:hypothetical protein